jgi:hypothetical protein
MLGEFGLVALGATDGVGGSDLPARGKGLVIIEVVFGEHLVSYEKRNNHTTRFANYPAVTVR